MSVFVRCLAVAMFVLSSGPIASAAQIQDPFYFPERRENDGFEPFNSIRLGAFADPATIEGDPVAFVIPESSVTPTRLQDFGLFQLVDDPVLRLFESGFPADFPTTDSVTIRIVDGGSSVSEVVVGPASLGLPTNFVPLVEEVQVTGGNSPTISWVLPDTEENLQALGIDYVRVRAISTGSVIDNGFIAISHDLDDTSIMLPDLTDLFSVSDLLLRVELVDDRDDFAITGEAPEEFTSLSSYVPDDQNRSTFQTNLSLEPTVVPLPGALPLMLTGALVIGVAARRQRWL